jgi:branched-subunit amino acid permease
LVLVFFLGPARSIPRSIHHGFDLAQKEEYRRQEAEYRMKVLVFLFYFILSTVFCILFPTFILKE